MSKKIKTSIVATAVAVALLLGFGAYTIGPGEFVWDVQHDTQNVLALTAGCAVVIWAVLFFFILPLFQSD